MSRVNRGRRQAPRFVLIRKYGLTEAKIKLKSDGQGKTVNFLGPDNIAGRKGIIDL